jgi:hypothetical protein
MAVPYLDSRAIQKRLDDAVGAMNWTNEFMLWQDKSQICGIGLYDAERGAWVMKYDGAENTDIEPVKGGLSDSFKRAAVLWGIGRYLYDMESIWVEIEPSGKSVCLKLADKNGKEISVYAKKGDSGLASGTKLRRAKFEKKQADFGPYITMPEYEIAA